VSRLGNEGILEYDEERGEKGCGGAAVETAESQVGQRDGGNSEGCRDHAHGHVWRILVYPG
jgi:hypothetical protein